MARAHRRPAVHEDGVRLHQDAGAVESQSSRDSWRNLNGHPVLFVIYSTTWIVRAPRFQDHKKY